MPKGQWSNLEKRDAIKREIALRKRVYPNRVETKRMSQQEADRQLSVMEAILRDYETALKGDLLI